MSLPQAMIRSEKSSATPHLEAVSIEPCLKSTISVIPLHVCKELFARLFHHAVLLQGSKLGEKMLKDGEVCASDEAR
jgi:hypothetical protein